MKPSLSRTASPPARTRLLRVEPVAVSRSPVLAAMLARLRGGRGLRPGARLFGHAAALRQVTLLFTDLHGSTAMYEQLGDLRAYALVRGHFARLQDLVAANGGAVVKTIGDAVMAAFPGPAPALRAALSMVRKATGDGLHLKAGLHAGLCVAVEFDDRVDYFGQAVNIAARAQGEARAGEVVCTRAVFEAPGAAHVIAAAGLRARERTVHLKGLRKPVTLFRLR